MNTSFADIAVTVSNMMANDTAAMDSGVSKTVANETRGFEKQLQREVRRFEKTEADVREVKKAVEQGRHVQTAKAKLEENTDNSSEETGVAFLSQLEQALLKISRGNLENVTMGSQGLDALKELLLKAGFNSEDVEGLISDLKDEAQGGSLKMNDVMDHLSQFVAEVDISSDADEVVLETSALPFLTTLLNDIGLSREDAEALMNKADRGQKGISLDVIIEELKQIDSQVKAAGEVVKIKTSGSSFESLMSQLNIPMEKSSGSEFSLTDLLAAFESYKIKNQASQAVSAAQAKATTVDATATQMSILSGTDVGESTGNIIDSLFKSFTLMAESAGQELAPEFSFQQVKEQFANDLILPTKGKNNKKGLFAETKSDLKSDALVKEMLPLLSKNSTILSTGTGQKTNLETFAKELKTEILKGGEHFEGAPGAKNELEGPGAGLKARSAQRPLPTFVTQQVERGIIRAINQGETSLKLQLKPAELGRLTLTIDNQGSSLKVTIVTENQAARDMLASNVNELKSALGNAGISLDSFDVDMNSDFKQSMADAGNQANQFNRKKGNKDKGEFNTNGQDGIEDIQTDQETVSMDGTYHFVA
jgi:flagellar hook-length control protein FliK